MIELQPSVKLFGKDIDDCYKNHSMPLSNRKENTMAKLRHEHISALTRAQNLLETAVDVDGNPMLSKSIQGDIVLLCQIREMLFFALENPTLPFMIEDTDTKPIAVTRGNKTNSNISTDDCDGI